MYSNVPNTINTLTFFFIVAMLSQTQATKAQLEANPKQFERMCLKPRTMIYFGENLGPLKTPNENIPSQTRIWLGSCGTFDSKETCTAMERCQWNEANKECSALDPEFKGGCILPFCVHFVCILLCAFCCVHFVYILCTF